MLQLRPPLVLKSWVESRMRLSLLFPRDFQNATYGQEEEFKPQYDHRPKKHDSSPTPYKTTQRERERATVVCLLRDIIRKRWSYSQNKRQTARERR